ncbi:MULTISPECIES: hypothetical protein [Streptomyces violaceusniger group]|uniref:Uncharacterized protein n=1 Tax=Streptomyces javensis TaxID=114698 RepID=A0ABS0RF89_9ACTN|nr:MULTISPECIES: hypothetical protein [Streptomyces violaceusniger group]MBI0316054.1 hypothetical protein [Streptomyces javensis]
MSTQPIEDSHDEPLFPMPPLTEQALRVAVRSLDLSAAVRFEEEFHSAWQEAVQTDSTVPMHTFLHRWGVFVALRRYPGRARRLHELEAAVAEAPNIEDARRASAEIGLLLDAARREVAA